MWSPLSMQLTKFSPCTYSVFDFAFSTGSLVGLQKGKKIGERWSTRRWNPNTPNYPHLENDSHYRFPKLWSVDQNWGVIAPKSKNVLMREVEHMVGIDHHWICQHPSQHLAFILLSSCCLICHHFLLPLQYTGKSLDTVGTSICLCFHLIFLLLLLPSFP